MTKKLYILFIFLTLTTFLFAQKDKLAEVARAYNAKDYDKAKELIDEVTVHPETSSLAITWLYRGFIYKDYYKTTKDVFDVTYTDKGGGIAQQTNVFNRWTYSFSAEKGTVVTFSAQHQKSGTVTVRITIDGIAFKETTSNGDNVIASVSGTLENSGNVTYTVLGGMKATSRIEALESLKKYLEMNEEGGNRKDAIKAYKYLSVSLYNDAANSLNPTEYKLAIENFEKYKKYIAFIKNEGDYDLTEQEIMFHLVLGSVYSQIYESDQKANKVFFNKIKNSYLYVIELNPNNYSGHYNLGILYYNESVNIIKNLDYETELMTLDLIQDECVALFKKSLPYMRKAYELNPKRKDVLVGLSGIYWSLNELEKSEAIDKELKILQQD